MIDARYKLNGTLVLLADDRILIVGGAARAEIFDSTKGVSEPVGGTFGTKRLFSAATMLRSGEVLITGGYDENLSIGQKAWIYRGQV